MLIAAQHFAAYNEGRVPEPTPTYVAGFHQWLSLGRSVAKGQHGYGILAPVTGRFASFTPDDPNSWRRLARSERPDVRRVRPHPHDRRQADLRLGHLPDDRRPGARASPPDAAPGPGTGRTVGRTGRTDHGRRLRAPSRLLGAAIGGANGLTDFLSREVSVRMDMDEAAQVKTLAHELAHVLLHAPADNRRPR